MLQISSNQETFPPGQVGGQMLDFFPVFRSPKWATAKVKKVEPTRLLSLLLSPQSEGLENSLAEHQPRSPGVFKS